MQISLGSILESCTSFSDTDSALQRLLNRVLMGVLMKRKGKNESKDMTLLIMVITCDEIIKKINRKK